MRWAIFLLCGAFTAIGCGADRTQPIADAYVASDTAQLDLGGADASLPDLGRDDAGADLGSRDADPGQACLPGGSVSTEPPLPVPNCFRARMIAGARNAGLAFTPTGELVVGLLFSGTVDIGLGEISSANGWDLLVGIFDEELVPVDQIHLTAEPFVVADVAANDSGVFVATGTLANVGEDSPPRVALRGFALDGSERFSSTVDRFAEHDIPGLPQYVVESGQHRFIHVQANSQGNVVLGFRDAAEASPVGVITFNTAGEELWRAPADGSTGRGIAVDEQGRVFSGASTWSADGEVLWNDTPLVGRDYSSGANPPLAAADGRLVQAGFATLSCESEAVVSEFGSELSVVASDSASRAVNWHRSFPGSELDPANGQHLVAQAHAIDAAGSTTIVAGLKTDDNIGWDFDSADTGTLSPFVAAFGPRGESRWLLRPAATGFSVPDDVAISDDARIALVGRVSDDGQIGGPGIFPELVGGGVFVYAACPE